jgi:3-dehydroquinate synthase
MTPPRKEIVLIDAGRHPVVSGRDALRELEHTLRHDERPGARFILGDENTLRHCLPELLARVPALGNAPTIEVRPGERSKDLEVCRGIWEFLARHEADRDALLITLGGGVVSDLGGFVASTFKRGIRVIHVPTSLMGMVDAAIGGKAGVDLAGVKNLVGAYHDPVAVFVHVPFLRTLGKRELMNGLAEMIKHALIHDRAQWEAIRTAPLHDLGALDALIQGSVAIKAAIVKEDPREGGLRKALNFGHTIGHALEAMSWESPQRVLLHGEAVAIGMVCEGWLAWRLGHLPREDFDGLEEHLLALFKPYGVAHSDHHRLIALMRNDKKNREGSMRFTLLERIGKAVIDVPVTAAQVKDALDHYRERVATIAQGTSPAE